jgi:hypothetical protein
LLVTSKLNEMTDLKIKCTDYRCRKGIGKAIAGLGQRRRKCDLSRQNAGGIDNVAAKPAL